jgi:hypothetical protein
MGSEEMSKAFKSFIRQGSSPRELSELMNELKTDGPRGTVVLAGALIDDFLRSAIEATLVELTEDEKKELFEGSGLLATFSARIKIGYAMGIYGRKTRHDLNTMRELRNAYAHVANKSIAFDTPSVVSLLRGCHCAGDI